MKDEILDHALAMMATLVAPDGIVIITVVNEAYVKGWDGVTMLDLFLDAF